MTAEYRHLEERIQELEALVTNLGVSLQDTKRRAFPTKTQTLTLDGMTRALCVETVDPLKQNRVRFYHPKLHDPDTPILALPFAKPVSAMGGFDDCGLNWVPPAGSTLCLLFDNGNRDLPYYIGTTWHVDRGVGSRDLIGMFGMNEYHAVHRGHRLGYLVGPNDESQVLPPWNTESYNGRDINSLKEFIDDPNEQRRTTYPNIYGMKTPQKNSIKMTDGNAKCNYRWKRLEIQSSCGNYMLFKDDHMHFGGQWGHPSCGVDGKSVDQCANTVNNAYLTDFHGKPIEGNQSCSGETSGETLGGHPRTPKNTKYQFSQSGSNPFFKHENECRPIKGPGTPQNNKIDLPQTGIQLLSISGQSFVMDDSVEEPQGVPNWERSTKDFDFGCNDKFLGKIEALSATGHRFLMSDIEKDTGVRGDQNKIELETATGNLFQMNDDTVKASDSGEDCVAGPKRGIHAVSTSKHELHMVDELNEQCGPTRKEGGIPQSKATKAYIQLISGYGLEYRANDDNSQEQTQSQFIQITNPQRARSAADDKANVERGPHFMRFQGRPQGEPGFIFLRAGGHSIRSTYDKDIVLVGDKEKNPSDKFTYVSKMFITSTEDVHFRYTREQHIFFAEKKIMLLAGRDCPPKEGKRCKAPCVYPVVIGRCPRRCHVTGWVHWTEKSLSERVFASGHHECQDPPNCDSCSSGKKAAYEAAMAAAQGPPCQENDEIGQAIDSANDASDDAVETTNG